MSQIVISTLEIGPQVDSNFWRRIAGFSDKGVDHCILNNFPTLFHFAREDGLSRRFVTSKEGYSCKVFGRKALESGAKAAFFENLCDFSDIFFRKMQWRE